MSPAERLADALPPEGIELILRELARVTHAGKTRIRLRHDRCGRIVDVEVAAAPPRVRVSGGVR